MGGRGKEEGVLKSVCGCLAQQGDQLSGRVLLEVAAGSLPTSKYCPVLIRQQGGSFTAPGINAKKEGLVHGRLEPGM